MNRRGFLAALAAVQTFAALPAWAAGESIESAIRNPAYSAVWVTVTSPGHVVDSSAAAEVTRIMRVMKQAGHPLSVTMVKPGRQLLRVHHNTRRAGIQEIAHPWNGKAVRYAIVYEPEHLRNISEGDIVSIMRQRTAAFVGGKVIVVSRFSPPAHLRDVAHFRL